MSFTAADLGASSTRYTSDSGNISVAPNNMIFLPSMEPSLIEPDSTDIESCLEVQIVKNEPDVLGFFPVNVLVGIMADKHVGISDRPSVLSHKHVQKINYVSAILACALAKIKYDVGDDIALYLTVPPIEIRDRKAEIAFGSELVGSYKVTFPKYMGGTTVQFNVTGVSCYAESYMASTSFFFNMNGTPKEASKKYLTGDSVVLSLDIGASTTDLAIIKNGKYLDKSGRTFKIGGNVARDTLIDLISERYATDLPVADAEKAMAEGRLKQGNSFDDVSDLVSIAKEKLSKQIVQYLPEYFKNTEIPITSINAIVVSGGGSLQSQYATEDGDIIKTTEPMSYFMTQEIVNWSRGTEVVEYGDEARFANIKGLFVRAKVDSIKKEQQRQQQQAAINQSVAMANGSTASQTATVAQATTVETPVAPTAPVAETPVAQAPTVETPVTPVTTVESTPVSPTAQEAGAVTTV